MRRKGKGRREKKPRTKVKRAIFRRQKVEGKRERKEVCCQDESSELILIPRPQGYGLALSKAWEELSRISDEGLVRRKGAAVDPKCGRLSVEFLTDQFFIDKNKREVYVSDSIAPPFLTVLILHYLINLSATTPTGEWVSFRQFEGGDFYYPAFRARTIDRLKKTFGGREEKFTEIASHLGGERIKFGDIAFRFSVFPRLVLAVVLHKPCEEFGSDANLLFDSSCLKLLPTEDAAVAASLLVSRLCKTT